MPAETQPLLARKVHATERSLVIVTADATYQIEWEKCSLRLAKVDFIERSRMILSPSGYGVHWPLIDEDLAIGALIHTGALIHGSPPPAQV